MICAPTVAGTYALPLLCFLLYCASHPDILPGGHWAGLHHPHSVGVNEFTLSITRWKVSERVLAMGRESPLPIRMGILEILEVVVGMHSDYFYLNL